MSKANSHLFMDFVSYPTSLLRECKKLQNLSDSDWNLKSPSIVEYFIFNEFVSMSISTNSVQIMD